MNTAIKVYWNTGYNVDMDKETAVKSKEINF